MADKLSTEQRSANMSRIRSKDTEPEMAVRRLAHAMGYRFQLHRRDLPGRPDLVFPRYKLAVFVHGCFWHRHEGCMNCTMPNSRRDFWAAKFEANVARDARAVAKLRESGWDVETIWECETRDRAPLARRLSAILTHNGSES